MARLRVFERLVRCQKCQLMAVGAVSWTRKIPSFVNKYIANVLNLQALQFNLGQRHARRGILAMIGVVHKTDFFAIGRNVKLIGTGLAPWQFKGRALQQVHHRTSCKVHDAQVRHTAHGQVVIPMAIHRILGGKGRVFARFAFFELVGLCRHAF